MSGIEAWQATSHFETMRCIATNAESHIGKRAGIRYTSEKIQKSNRAQKSRGKKGVVTYFSVLLGAPREGKAPGRALRESAEALDPGRLSRAGRFGPARAGVWPCM
jgi:hypothetical protein